MQVYNRYIFRTTFIATIFISLILVAVTMLTQSLRFLELIVESGASTWSFWILTFLNLPRFLEIIIPIGLSTSVIFILNRMTIDSELSVLKATGFSHWSLARPILLIALLFSLLLLLITTWLGPISIAKTNFLKHALKSEFTGLLFKDGVFNDVSDGLTFYIRELNSDGELNGIIIHDSRVKTEPAKTIYAQRGVLVETNTGNAILVFDGARQDYDEETDTLQSLSFARYSIDLPDEQKTTKERFKKPKEFTFSELLSPDPAYNFNQQQLRDIRVEAHLRILGPFLALGFVFIASVSMLRGSINRRGQGSRIMYAICSIIFIQSIFIALSDAATKSSVALIACYVVILTPIVIGLQLLRDNRKEEKN